MHHLGFHIAVADRGVAVVVESFRPDERRGPLHDERLSSW